MTIVHIFFFFLVVDKSSSGGGGVRARGKSRILVGTKTRATTSRCGQQALKRCCSCGWLRVALHDLDMAGVGRRLEGHCSVPLLVFYIFE